MRQMTILLLAGLLVTGCQQNIGDSCSSSVDCSKTGQRQCDLAQPGGYCTVFACDADTCPQGACVEWRYVPSRTAQTWCMKTCSSDGNCRSQYSCVVPNQITASGGVNPAGGEKVARIIDLDSAQTDAKICVALYPNAVVPSSEQFEPDGGL